MPSDFTIYDMMEAVKWMTPARAMNMKNDCITRASEFSIENFHKKIKGVLEL
jgi:hypothetical protein